jgi:hypothetical protein
MIWFANVTKSAGSVLSRVVAWVELGDVGLVDENLEYYVAEICDE